MYTEESQFYFWNNNHGKRWRDVINQSLKLGLLRYSPSNTLEHNSLIEYGKSLNCYVYLEHLNTKVIDSDKIYYSIDLRNIEKSENTSFYLQLSTIESEYITSKPITNESISRGILTISTLIKNGKYQINLLIKNENKPISCFKSNTIISIQNRNK